MTAKDKRYQNLQKKTVVLGNSRSLGQPLLDGSHYLSVLNTGAL